MNPYLTQREGEALFEEYEEKIEEAYERLIEAADFLSEADELHADLWPTYPSKRLHAAMDAVSDAREAMALLEGVTPR